MALHVGRNIHQDHAVCSTALSVLDLAAGGRMLCRLHESMCALQPSASRMTCEWSTRSCDARRREDNTIAGFALLDRGSGNEVITGSVRYGVYWHICHCNARHPAAGDRSA